MVIIMANFDNIGLDDQDDREMIYLTFDINI